MARCGLAQAGDQVESPAGTSDPTVNVVGQLVSFTEIDPQSSVNEVDAAVAEPNGAIQMLNEIPQIGAVSATRDLRLEGDDSAKGLGVQKFGAATGFQTGTIRNVHVSTSIVYPQLPQDPSVGFIELVQYDALSREGDSGAAVLDTAKPPNIVGMHLAGMPDGTASFFTHIQFVFDALGVGL
jgi:hypothetical protein